MAPQSIAHPQQSRFQPHGFAARLDGARLKQLAASIPTVAPRDAMAVHAPWSGEQIGALPCLHADDVAHAVDRARAAQSAWAKRPFRKRAAVLLRFHDLLLRRQNALLDLIQLESGKARVHALEEVLDVAIVARYYAFHGERALRTVRRKGSLPGFTAAWELRHPHGVVGIIAPWNYPLSMAITDAIPALLAGNAVVLKPDPQTPFTALWAVDLLREAGLPPDLFGVVTGDGPAVGQALIDHVDYVTFTGSTATGRAVAKHAAERLIGCSLELGGKNAMIVLDDAPLNKAVDGAIRGCFASAGQLCVSTERLFVHAAVYDSFVQQFAQRARTLRLGAGFDYRIDMGSLVSARQLAAVQAHVDDALAGGARLLAGGRPRPDLGPSFFEPTVLEGVQPGMRVFAEETFGPVVAVYRVASAAEAVEQANASQYGLNASIWTGNPLRGRTLAARLEAGTVSINDGYAAAWSSVDAPMGGRKLSGLGRRHGAEGIRCYTVAQTVAAQRGIPLAAPRGVSNAMFARIMTLYLRVLRRVPGLR